LGKTPRGAKRSNNKRRVRGAAERFGRPRKNSLNQDYSAKLGAGGGRQSFLPLGPRRGGSTVFRAGYCALLKAHSLRDSGAKGGDVQFVQMFIGWTKGRLARASFQPFRTSRQGSYGGHRQSSVDSYFFTRENTCHGGNPHRCWRLALCTARVGSGAAKKLGPLRVSDEHDGGGRRRAEGGLHQTTAPQLPGRRVDGGAPGASGGYRCNGGGDVRRRTGW